MSDLNTELAQHGVILAQRNGLISLFPLDGSPFASEWDALRGLYPQAERGDPALRRAFATLYKRTPTDMHTLLSEQMPRSPQNQISMFLEAYDDEWLVSAVREWDEQRLQNPQCGTPTLDRMGEDYMGEAHLSPAESVQLHSQIIVHIQDGFAQRGLPRTAFTQSDMPETRTASFADMQARVSTQFAAPASPVAADARPGTEVIVRTQNAPDEDVRLWVHAVHTRGRDTLITGRISEGPLFGHAMTITPAQVFGLHTAPAHQAAYDLAM